MKKNSIIVLTIILLAVVVIGIRLLTHHNAKTTTTAAPIPVTTVAVKHALREDTVTTQGHLDAIHSANITAKVDGYIQSLNFKEGQHVDAGQTLITLHANTERDALAEDNADLKLAQLNFERNEKLLKTAAVSPQMMDALKAAYQKAQATSAAAQVSVSNKTLTAPFNGTMGVSTLNVGDYVKSGTALAPITDEKTLKAVFDLPAQYINAVHPGAHVMLRAKQGEASAKTAAIVSFVSPNINTDTQTFEVHATFDNSSHLFHPGEYVQIAQTLGPPKQVLVIPERSIVESITGANVYVIKNHKANLIPVTLAATFKNQAVVSKGLALHQAVITDGIMQIKSGATVVVTS
jgi:RND family efflux transporter MFP subunit